MIPANSSCNWDATVPDPASLNDPLASLRPIVLPEHGVSYWPLAPGWWILLGLLATGLLLAWYLRPRLMKVRHRRKLQRDSLQALDALYEQCRQQNNQAESLQHYLQGCNDIFKRSLHWQHPGSAALSLCGEPWVQWLQKHNPAAAQADFSRHFGNGLYGRRCDGDMPLLALHTWAKHWLQHFHKKGEQR